MTYNNANYVCIGTGDVTGETPSSSDAWDVYDLVNDYLRRLMRDNVAKVIKRGGGDVGEVVTVTVETKAFSLILK